MIQDAEQNVIGSVIYDNSLHQKVSFLREAHFTEPIYGAVWVIVTECIGKSQAVSVHTIAERLGTSDGFQSLGGMSWLMAMFSGCQAYSVEADGLAVREAWIKRQVGQLGQGLVKSATDPQSATDLLDHAKGLIESIERGSGLGGDDILSSVDVADDVVAEIERIFKGGSLPTMMTGLACVDQGIDGFMGGMLVVIGGRPGMGKTMLARAIVHGAAVHNPNKQHLFIGLEMGPHEMMKRELSAISFESGGVRVQHNWMRGGKMSAEQVKAVYDCKRLVPANLSLSAPHGVGLDDVRRQIYALSRKGPVGVVAIDYLQIMNRDEWRGGNDAAIIGKITAGLKSLSRQFDCTILLLSQLSRTLESRDDKRPMLSDLRESGAIEQDADVVMFPFREAYYLEKQGPQEGKELEHEANIARCINVMDVNLAKVRHGPCATIKQFCQPAFDFVGDLKN
jgi:replicative DNA helicase